MRFKLVFKTIIFSLIPLLLLLVAAEIFLAIFGIGQPFIRESQFWTKSVKLMQPDKYTGFRMKPFFSEGPVRLNSLGLRGEEPDSKATIKILSLGDSCAFGWLVDDAERTYARQLQHSLNFELMKQASGARVDAVNAGIPSYTVYQGLELYLNYLKPLARWDFMLVTFGWNENPDLELDLEFTMRNVPIESHTLHFLRDNVARRLRLYNALESMWYRMIITNVEDPYLQAQVQYEKFYTQLVRIAKKSGTQVVIMPVIIPPDASTANADRMRVFNAITRKIAMREGVLWIDLNDEFSKMKRTIKWYDEFHYNEKGHEVVANALKGLLLQPCLDKLGRK